MSHGSFAQKAASEVKTVALVTCYFALCFALMMFLKSLVLTQYSIEFHGLSLALVGALVAAKVVLVLEHVPLGSWVRRQPAIVEALLRTLLYTVGVLVVLLLEKAFESRHEFGGFGSALVKVFEHREISHVWAATIGISTALLSFNLFSLLCKEVGITELKRIFLEKPSPR